MFGHRAVRRLRRAPPFDLLPDQGGIHGQTWPFFEIVYGRRGRGTTGARRRTGEIFRFSLFTLPGEKRWRTTALQDASRVTGAAGNSARSWSAPVLWRFDRAREMNNGRNFALGLITAPEGKRQRVRRIRWCFMVHSVLGGYARQSISQHLFMKPFTSFNDSKQTRTRNWPILATPREIQSMSTPLRSAKKSKLDQTLDSVMKQTLQGGWFPSAR